jgi:hypothetical protein
VRFLSFFQEKFVVSSEVPAPAPQPPARRPNAQLLSPPPPPPELTGSTTGAAEATESVRRKLEAWLSTVESSPGGTESTAARRFDPSELVAFAVSEGLCELSAEDIYRQHVAWTVQR